MSNHHNFQQDNQILTEIYNKSLKKIKTRQTNKQTNKNKQKKNKKKNKE